MTNVQILILAWLFLVSILVIIQNRELGALGDKNGHKEPVEKRGRYKDPDYHKNYNRPTSSPSTATSVRSAGSRTASATVNSTLSLERNFG